MSLTRIIASLALSTIATMAYPGPAIKWLKSTHNFGTIRESDGRVTCTFRAVNIGDADLAVLDARANCGCTTPTYNHEPIAPGDTLTITVSYDPSGRPGRFNKQVKVTNNATEKPSTLIIRGTSIAAGQTLTSRYPVAVGSYRTSNDICNFGSTRKGRVVAAAVNIYNPTTDTIYPAVDNLPSYINAVFSPKRILAGEQGVLSLTAYTDQCDQWGIVDGQFTLTPDTRHPADTLTVSTVVTINEDFSSLSPAQLLKAPVAKLSSPVIDFQRITAAKTLHSTLTITNTGKEPLLIRRIYSADAAVTAAAKASVIKPGKKTVINVSYDASTLTQGRFLNSEMTIITNAPSSPSIKVRIVGENAIK